MSRMLLSKIKELDELQDQRVPASILSDQSIKALRKICEEYLTHMMGYFWIGQSQWLFGWITKL